MSKPTLIGTVLWAAAAVAVAGSGGQSDLASPWVELHQARVRLLAGPSVAKAEGSLLAGVELALTDGWKTYWRMPGDAGVPPSFDWTGSINVGSIRVLYPAPVRMREPAAQTVGYKAPLVFPVEVRPKDRGSPVVLNLAMEFGLCHDICIPAEAKLSLTVRPSDMSGAPSAAMLAALERVPRAASERRTSDPELKRVTASLTGQMPRLLIEARFAHGEGADLFVEAGEGAYLPLPQRLADAPDGTARFAVDLSHDGNAQELKGKLLRLTLISAAGASEFLATVP
jgi:DsbC/DsbD-like thiol-disulfide interchange protein